MAAVGLIVDFVRLNSAGVNLAAVPAPYAPNPEAAKRFIEYFAANIRNLNTRRAYLHAVREFADWCALQEFHEIVDIGLPLIFVPKVPFGNAENYRGR